MHILLNVWGIDSSDMYVIVTYTNVDRSLLDIGYGKSHLFWMVKM
jgi:hypothetical protein